MLTQWALWEFPGQNMPGISFDYIRFSHNNLTQKVVEKY
jgi:hypothetical protein